MKNLHDEVQPFFPLIWKVVIIFFSVGMLILFYTENQEEANEIWIWILILAVLGFSNYAVWALKLHLIITPYDVRFRYPPFINSWKIIPKESIENYKIDRYDWFKFGGWGYRFNLFHGGWAYTVFNKYVLVLKPNGKSQIRIGTFKPEAVQQAMNKVIVREDG